MRLFIAAVFSCIITNVAMGDFVTINGTQYEFDGTPTTVSHGFLGDQFSSPVSFTNQRYVRVTGLSIGGFIAPPFTAGTFFVNNLGYIQNAELMIYKAGNAPKRASQLFVYSMNTNSALTPNGNPSGQVNSTYNFLHDFIIDTSLLTGPTSNYSLRLTIGEDYFDTSQADNGGTNSYRLDGLHIAAVPEPSSLMLMAAIGSIAVGFRYRRQA